MSKIIEALKVRSSGAPKDSLLKKTPNEIRVERSSHELTQEQLADIYFSATGKDRTAEPPTIIRVVEKTRLATTIPWLIACFAFLVALFTLFPTKMILVDVKILDEKSAAHYGLSRRAPETESSASVTHASTTISAEGASHQFAVQDFLFEGAAYLNSSKDKNGTLSLINSSVAPFARATLLLDPPLDLSRAKIVFYAKGGRGAENIAFSLKDKDNIQGFYKGKLFPFPNRLSTSWQKAEIKISEETAMGFDPQNVTSLRFEFGSKDTGNKPGDLVLVKDLQWTSGEDSA